MKRLGQVVPIVAAAMSGPFAIGCKGGGLPDGVDGGGLLDSGPTSQSTSSQACEKATIAIDDTAASGDGTSPGCANDNECTVRFAGDYCACPSTPRPMLTSRAAAFDQSLEGVTKKCTCEIMPCEPLLAGKAVCNNGRCVLAGNP